MAAPPVAGDVRRSAIRIPVEVLFTLAMVVATALLGWWKGLALNLPTAEGASFIGVHYFYPLFAVVPWLACSTLLGREARLAGAITMLMSYAVVMVLHFNVKLWAPFINPQNFDLLYWHADEAVRPLIDLCIKTTAGLRRLWPWIDGMYMLGFIALFFISFCVHAVRSPVVFRRVFLAAIFLQGFGALSYLVMPAIGPFLYEPGAIPGISSSQAHMLSARHDALALGSAWFMTPAAQAHLLTGLAAMPSLHAGGSFLFLYFVARYERPLLLLYVPLFLFILIAAIGTRWHYAIDLPVGIALAGFCIALANRLDGVSLEIPSPLRPRANEPVAI